MEITKITIILHTVFSGIFAFLVTYFFASGAIAENYTGNTFSAPIFFLIIVIWLIGLLFLVFRRYHTSIQIMWLSIPGGMIIAFPIAMVL